MEDLLRSESDLGTVIDPTVVLIGSTAFVKPPHIEWETDAPDASEALIELAGRTCYRSFDNPAGRTNAEYIRNLMSMGHLSVIEHSFASFYISGVSRSFTHELVRHRHLSFSQLSQRYVDGQRESAVEPRAIADDAELHAIFVEVNESARRAYGRIVTRLEERFADVPNDRDRRKLVREAARAVLPNATQTEIVVSGNYRAWRHFLMLRCSPHAEAEIRRVAIEILGILEREAPAVFDDFERISAPDGSPAARPVLVAE